MRLLKIDLKECFQLLASSLEKISISRVNLINVPFANDCIGTLSLRGTGEILDLIKAQPDICRGLITKIEFSFVYDDQTRHASLTNQGALICDDSVAANITPIIYKKLSLLVS